jgi:hypothetical protein
MSSTWRMAAFSGSRRTAPLRWLRNTTVSRTDLPFRGACGWGCGDNIDPAIAAISVLLIIATVALVLVRLVWREAAERRMRQRQII